MTREIRIGYGDTAALESRIHTLENQVAILADALRVLAAGIEGTPLDEPTPAATSRAARTARELLLTTGLGSRRH